MKGTHVHFENKIPAPLPVLPVLVPRAPRSEFESAAQTPTLCTLAEELSLDPSYPGSVGCTLLSRISKAEPQAWNLSMGLYFLKFPGDFNFLGTLDLHRYLSTCQAPSCPMTTLAAFSVSA